MPVFFSVIKIARIAEDVKPVTGFYGTAVLFLYHFS